MFVSIIFVVLFFSIGASFINVYVNLVNSKPLPVPSRRDKVEAAMHSRVVNPACSLGTLFLDQVFFVLVVDVF